MGDEWDFGPEELGPVVSLKHSVESGTITSAQRGIVRRETHCRVAVRDRQRGSGRQIFITGRSSKIHDAHALTLDFIAANGAEGGRRNAQDQEFHRRQERAVADAIRRSQEAQLRPMHDSRLYDCGFWYDQALTIMWPHPFNELPNFMYVNGGGR
eukprot:9477746-Pyramimonas_sp.AAC.1